MAMAEADSIALLPTAPAELASVRAPRRSTSAKRPRAREKRDDSFQSTSDRATSEELQEMDDGSARAAASRFARANTSTRAEENRCRLCSSACRHGGAGICFSTFSIDVVWASRRQRRRGMGPTYVYDVRIAKCVCSCFGEERSSRKIRRGENMLSPMLRG